MKKLVKALLLKRNKKLAIQVAKVLAAADIERYSVSFRMVVDSTGDMPDINPETMLERDNTDGEELGFEIKNIKQKLVKKDNRYRTYDASCVIELDLEWCEQSAKEIIEHDATDGEDIGYEIFNIKVKKV